jgi:hypothetical protein
MERSGWEKWTQDDCMCPRIEAGAAELLRHSANNSNVNSMIPPSWSHLAALVSTEVSQFRCKAVVVATNEFIVPFAQVIRVRFTTSPSRSIQHISISSEHISSVS